MAQQYDRDFKQNAVSYHYDHPELTLKECAKKLGVPYDTYHGWISAHNKKAITLFEVRVIIRLMKLKKLPT